MQAGERDVIGFTGQMCRVFADQQIVRSGDDAEFGAGRRRELADEAVRSVAELSNGREDAAQVSEARVASREPRFGGASIKMRPSRRGAYSASARRAMIPPRLCVTRCTRPSPRSSRRRNDSARAAPCRSIRDHRLE